MAISQAQKEHLSERANNRCEYCLLHENHSAKKHEPDHIIPKKHNGKDNLDNLAWACFQCNRYKGSEVAAFDPQTGNLTALFNPRRDNWDSHFYIEAGSIKAKTEIGRVTELILQLNRPTRVQVRLSLIKARLYPENEPPNS